VFRSICKATPKVMTTVAMSIGLLFAAGGVAAASSAPSVASPGSAPAVVCAGSIVVNSFVFNPAQVAPGQSSAATLVATNCTAATLATTQTWTGRFIGATSTGIPAGCPVIDPLQRSVSMPPQVAVSTTTSYLVFSSCTAVELQVTVTIRNSSGTTLAVATADLRI
jgi:hypothetical protein